ncbi:hypothetical protein KEM55_003140 [Ascosphaera atra]|nr:hypothetical protein KEM55_003140 [Ascosphaera atra]
MAAGLRAATPPGLTSMRSPGCDLRGTAFGSATGAAAMLTNRPSTVSAMVGISAVCRAVCHGFVRSASLPQLRSCPALVTQNIK